MTSIDIPNGVKTVNTLDTMGRLTNLAISKGASVLASYTYTYGTAGNKTSAAESGGRNAAYNYDAIYRLVTETVSGDAGGKNGALGYGLDSVGN